MREENLNAVKVLLVGLDTGEEPDFEHSMEELKVWRKQRKSRLQAL